MDFFSQAMGQVMQDEGFKPFIYQDSTGHRTIGYGHNLEEGITEEMATEILLVDLHSKYEELIEKFPEYVLLDEARQLVLLNMAFNLGVGGVMAFEKMIASIRAENYKQAAMDMLDSLWAKQVGERAIQLAKMMEDG